MHARAIRGRIFSNHFHSLNVDGNNRMFQMLLRAMLTSGAKSEQRIIKDIINMTFRAETTFFRTDLIKCKFWTLNNQ